MQHRPSTQKPLAQVSGNAHAAPLSTLGWQRWASLSQKALLAQSPLFLQLVVQAPPPPTPLYKKWWLWTCVVGGVVVIGGGAAAVGISLTTPNQPSVLESLR